MSSNSFRCLRISWKPRKQTNQTKPTTQTTNQTNKQNKTKQNKTNKQNAVVFGHWILVFCFCSRSDVVVWECKRFMHRFGSRQHQSDLSSLLYLNKKCELWFTTGAIPVKYSLVLTVLHQLLSRWPSKDVAEENTTLTPLGHSKYRKLPSSPRLLL